MIWMNRLAVLKNAEEFALPARPSASKNSPREGDGQGGSYPTPLEFEKMMSYAAFLQNALWCSQYKIWSKTSQTRIFLLRRGHAENGRLF